MKVFVSHKGAGRARHGGSAGESIVGVKGMGEAIWYDESETPKLSCSYRGVLEFYRDAAASLSLFSTEKTDLIISLAVTLRLNTQRFISGKDFLRLSADFQASPHANPIINDTFTDPCDSAASIVKDKLQIIFRNGLLSDKILWILWAREGKKHRERKREMVGDMLN